jgi:hypothetical protein
MPAVDFSQLFNESMLKELMPPEKTDQFFEALFGDASEGAYDISLAFKQGSPDRLEFEFHLTSKPGKCLACNLTYGLPNVFARHPVINIKGLSAKIAALLQGGVIIDNWHCGETIERTADLHVIPLYLEINRDAP